MGRDFGGPKLPVMLPTASLFKLPVSAAGPWLSRTVLGEGRDVGLLVEVAVGGREEAKSSEEALSVAKFHACPACLGRGLCPVKDFFFIFIFHFHVWGGDSAR